jgi:hypothetical protein
MLENKNVCSNVRRYLSDKERSFQIMIEDLLRNEKPVIVKSCLYF